MTNLPASQRAEESVLGAILRDPAITTEIVGTMLEPDQFYYSPYRLVFEAILERHYADDPIDALTVAEAVSKRTASIWKVEEREAVDRVVALSSERLSGETTAVEHAAVIKRHADYRSLLGLAERLRNAVLREEETPEEIAGAASTEAMQIATDSLVRHETLSYGELGRNWTRETQRQIAARETGVQMGAYFGIPAIDTFTKGLRPTELLVCAGDPGTGKSAVWWIAAERFAQRQMGNPEDRRIGTLILSLEMGEVPSSGRMAMSVGRVEGEKIREGTLSREELRQTAQKWAAQRDLPLYVNHASRLRTSQVRAIIVDEIRRHNIGLVVLDHFRKVSPDTNFTDRNQSDDYVVEFLKAMAKDLDIAIVCIAHTVKGTASPDRRPQMNDLRGSGGILAEADFICFVYRPYKHAPQRDREQGRVTVTDAEMIWEKSRHSGDGVSADFYLNLAKMQVR